MDQLLGSRGPPEELWPGGLSHLCGNGRCDSRDQRVFLASSRHQGWRASLEETGLECSSQCCSELIHVWTMLGLAQLYLLPLLVLVFKCILQMKKVTFAVFWSKWKKKAQACFSCFCVCVKQAG